MREIRTEIEINASINTVWRILTDLNNWKAWNPIKEARGVATPGAQLTITMGGGRQYQPIVTEVREPKSFRWRGKMMAGFLMTNDKAFELEKAGSGTRLIHRERFSGLLVPLFWGKMNQGVPPMLKSMNESLKKEAEKR
ncbi:MAG TPA: SRPBCC domain-containing protein [Nitrospiria bacterium]